MPLMFGLDLHAFIHENNITLCDTFLDEKARCGATLGQYSGIVRPYLAISPNNSVNECMKPGLTDPLHIGGHKPVRSAGA